MKRLIVIMTVLLLIVLPTAAQENLPPGCNIGKLGDLFTAMGENIGQVELSPADAVFFIDELSEALTATRNACDDDAPLTDENSIDYSVIAQSRTEDGAFVLGDPDAPITIVEFADFMCPHCQNYHSTVQELIENYVATGQAKFEYRFFPVVDANLSPLTARMAECADILQPGSFWSAHDVMFELTSNQFTSFSLYTFAARVGLDYDEMLTCAQETANQVGTDTDLARAIEVTGTPSILVRYGDGDLEDIKVDGNSVSRSSVPLLVLASVIEDAQSTAK
jgi:protein-disulfide isomerase